MEASRFRIPTAAQISLFLLLPVGAGWPASDHRSRFSCFSACASPISRRKMTPDTRQVAEDLLHFQKRRDAFHFRRASSSDLVHLSEPRISVDRQPRCWVTGNYDAPSSVHCRTCSECARPLGPANCLHHGSRNLEPESARDGCARHRTEPIMSSTSDAVMGAA